MPKHKTRKVTRKVKKGGVINKLPIDVPSQLSDWDMFYCASHGLIGNSVKIVPKNTFILFLAPCGGKCSTTESLINMLTDTDTLYNTLTGNTDILPLYDSSRLQNYSDNTTIGIYEPGDKYPDMALQFKNDIESGFLDMGLYKLPISKQIFTFMDTTQQIIKRKMLNTVSGVKQISLHEINKFIKEKDKNMLLRNDNLLHDFMSSFIDRNITPTFRLSTIVDLIASTERGKPQLIIVNACRVSTSNSLCRQTRRLSLNQRKLNTHK